MTPEEKRARHRAYYAANKERYRGYQKAARRRDPDKRRGWAARWRKENKGHVSGYNAAYAAANREAIRLRTKLRRSLSGDKEKCAAQQRAWYTKNKQKKYAHNRNRRAMQIAADGVHSADDISQILKLQKGKCAYCRCSVGGKYHVDHIVALSKGGSNWPKNLQITCGSCNSRKRDKSPEDFAREIGRLI